MKRMILAAVMAAVGVPAAAASDGQAERFFNQPGMSAASLEAELRRCDAITLGPATGGHAVRDSHLLSPPLASGGAQGGVVPPGDTIEDCMIGRGWRVFALSEREARSIARQTTRRQARIRANLTTARIPRYGRLVRDAAPVLLRAPSAPAAH